MPLLMYISKIIKEFEKLPYEGYVQKGYKHRPIESYFYPSIQLPKCMTRLNLHVGPVRTKTTKMKKMNISEMNTKKIPNFCVYSSDDNE